MLMNFGSDMQPGKVIFHETNLKEASLQAAFLSHICLACANLKEVAVDRL
jgi:hypothetical protein